MRPVRNSMRSGVPVRLNRSRNQPSKLPPERFRQVHRVTVVSMDEVAAAVREDAGRVSLRLRRRRETLAVNCVFAHLFRQM